MLPTVTPAARALLAEMLARELDGLDVIVRQLRAAGYQLSADFDASDPEYELVVEPIEPVR